jgi:hypothetical protein
MVWSTDALTAAKASSPAFLSAKDNVFSNRVNPFWAAADKRSAGAVRIIFGVRMLRADRSKGRETWA